MSNFNLIPFGLHTPSASLKDVGSVNKGSQCDCICPSCKTPLIARQGEVKEWHFAHQSRGTKKITETPCEYSLEVSLRLMMKQLLEEGVDFYLPEYSKSFSVPLPGTANSYIKTVIISPEAKVKFDGVEIEKRNDDVLFDLVLTKGKHRLYVYITYHGRPFPQHLLYGKPVHPIIEFNAIALLNAFSETKTGQYKEVLNTFLASTVMGKKWRSHPREELCLEQLHVYVNDNIDALMERYTKHEHISSTVMRTSAETDSQNNLIMARQKTASANVVTSENAEAIANKREEIKRALHGEQNGTRVLLGGLKASFTDGSCSFETIIGRVDSLSPKFLHRCIACNDEWVGASNNCNTCHSHKTTRSVFNH